MRDTRRIDAGRWLLRSVGNQLMKRSLIALIALPIALSGCEEDTPLGDVPHVDGTYDGTWTLSWETNNPIVNPPGMTSFCPGSITLENGFRDAIDGSFLIRDEGDCADGSPVSGALIDGFLRVDGGINFTLQVPPGVGQEKSEDDIWEDVFAGSAVILPDLIVGCLIIDADNQMTGAVSAGRLAGSASASVSCPDPPTDQPTAAVQLQIRFEGTR